LGGILLTGGLYSVLWAKSKENMTEPCSEANATDSAQDAKGEKTPAENPNNCRGENAEKVSSDYAVERV
jgi:hypothetical protein